MNRFTALVIGLSVLMVGCGGSTTEPSEGTSATTTFTVPLSPANEVPAITNADAGSSGTATISLIVTTDALGYVTAATANFQINVTGLPPGTTVTDAHIHNGAAGTNASVYVNTGLSSGDVTLVDGTGSATKNGINVPADKAAAILANPAGHYFNVHTTRSPDGAMRGQLSSGAASVARH